MKQILAKVALKGRDEMELLLNVDDSGEIRLAQLSGIGCPELLRHMAQMRPQLRGRVEDLRVPEGVDHSSLLMRELVARVQGKWKLPYFEEELCHCRAIPTAVVDAAIVSGAHTTKEVSRLTSAGTGCGTCRPDTESIIEYRIKR